MHNLKIQITDNHACIRHALEMSYKYARLRPGDYCMEQVHSLLGRARTVSRKK